MATGPQELTGSAGQQEPADPADLGGPGEGADEPSGQGPEPRAGQGLPEQSGPHPRGERARPSAPGNAESGGPEPAAATGGSLLRLVATRSPFTLGFTGALGAIVAYLLVKAVISAQDVLVLVLISIFIAVSLDPVVVWLERHRVRRGWAVLLVVLALIAVLVGFVATVVPLVTGETEALVKALPGYIQQLHDHHSFLGRLEDKYHIAKRVQSALSSAKLGSLAVGGLLGAGKLVFTALTSTVIVLTLSIYFLVGMPALKRFCYSLVPRSRRERVSLLTEETLARVGRFMLGNVLTSAVAGLATFVWLEIVGVPYAAALGIFVGVMDMVPTIGSTIGGAVVTLIALTVSVPVALATLAFYVAFRLAEDYLIMPRAMKYTVDVHPIVTVVAVLIGGALLGVTGALIGIPVAVGIKLILEEVALPRLERA
jgi:predicted PurR-regulated permease PerM